MLMHLFDRKDRYNTVVDLSPPIAESWLTQCNTHNRKLVEAHAERLAGEMKADRWQLNHQGIAFSENLNYQNFIRVAYGLKKINKESWKAELINKNLMETGRLLSIDLRKGKLDGFEKSVDHIDYIKHVLSQYKYN